MVSISQVNNNVENRSVSVLMLYFSFSLRAFELISFLLAQKRENLGVGGEWDHNISLQLSEDTTD